MLEAIYNAVIIKPLESEEADYGGIIVPDVGNEKNTMGEVIAVGPGMFTSTGQLIPTQLKIGDKVVLPTQGFTKLPYKGDEYWVGMENKVLAKVND